MLPDRRVGIALGEDGANVFHGQAVRCRRDRIDLDAHGEFLRPVHQNLGDTRQLRNLLRQCDLAVVVDWDTGSVDEVRLNWMIG